MVSVRCTVLCVCVCAYVPNRRAAAAATRAMRIMALPEIETKERLFSYA